MYKSLIHPYLEYTSALWGPHSAKDIKTNENVQKFALRFCTKNWNANYESLLVQHNLNSMAVCRTFTRLCLLFKIIHRDVFYLNLPYTFVTQQDESRHLNSQQITVQFLIKFCVWIKHFNVEISS